MLVLSPQAGAGVGPAQAKMAKSANVRYVGLAFFDAGAPEASAQRNWGGVNLSKNRRYAGVGHVSRQRKDCSAARRKQTRRRRVADLRAGWRSLAEKTGHESGRGQQSQE